MPTSPVRLSGKKAQANDWTALFAEFVAAHHADMLRLAYGMVGDVDAAADVVQTSWTAAWEHRSQLRDASKVRGWLLTITANQSRKALRRRRVRRFLPLIDAQERSGVRNADADGQIDLVAAVQHLPVRDRQILVLRYGLGESSAEIGRQVGLSDAGVRVRLGRVISALRAELDK
jgi:RNA polymerase sigma factor (sigma-70 family)